MGSEEKARPLLSVIDAVHDYLEGKTPQEALEGVLETAFVEGASGIWEATGNWLLKLCKESASFQALWLRLARHSTAIVRYRVACHLDSIPEPAVSEVSELLLSDKSRKVRDMASARTEPQQ